MRYHCQGPPRASHYGRDDRRNEKAAGTTEVVRLHGKKDAYAGRRARCIVPLRETPGERGKINISTLA